MKRETISYVYRGGSRTFIVCALIMLVALGVSTEMVAAGDIFVCPDGNGKKHFTNTPESPRCVPFHSTRSVSFSINRSWGGAASSTSRMTWRTSYDKEISLYADRYRVDPALVKAVIRVESNFDRRAVSRRGAQGLMQLMPETARELMVSDPFDPRQNIEGGTRYLRTLLDMFDGNVTLALAAYNAGPTVVRRTRHIPAIPETVHYIKRVLSYYEGYGQGRIADAYDRSQINVRKLVTVQ